MNVPQIIYLHSSYKVPSDLDIQYGDKRVHKYLYCLLYAYAFSDHSQNRFEQMQVVVKIMLQKTWTNAKKNNINELHHIIYHLRIINISNMLPEE